MERAKYEDTVLVTKNGQRIGYNLGKEKKVRTRGESWSGALQ